MIPDMVTTLRLALVWASVFYLCNSSVSIACGELAKVSLLFPFALASLAEAIAACVQCYFFPFLVGRKELESAHVCKADGRHSQNGGWFSISSL